MTSSPSARGSIRALWTALMLLTAAAAGTAAGLLASEGGAEAPNAVLTGAGAFASALLLLLTVAHYLEDRKS
jgi:hypothetical protein